MDFPAHPFWDFSLRVYGAEGVAPACLALQDRHRIDVNVLLFCCWLGAAGYAPLSPGRMREIVALVDPWHRGVVCGLRAVRKTMKSGVAGAPAAPSEKLRRKIASVEVECEHLEQLMLAELVDGQVPGDPPPPTRLAAAKENIRCYFNSLDKILDARDQSRLDTVLRAAVEVSG